MKDNALITLIRKWSWVLIVLFLVIGWWYPLVGLTALICMFIPLIIAAWKGGRVWCGNFCPRGSFNDNILSSISRSLEIPDFFRTVYFRAFFLIFLFFNLIKGTINAQGDWVKIGLVFYRIIFLTTTIAIVLGIIFHQRTWCAFCPVGSLSALIVKIKRKFKYVMESITYTKDKRIKVDVDKCVECDLCAKECPMNLKPYEFTEDGNKDIDCLHCEDCVYACPVNALEKR
jgi:polyferredoxin